MADGEGRHIPRIVLEQERDARVIHDVAMLDAMGAGEAAKIRIQSVFRNSISAILSGSLRLVPYSWPLFELPGRRVSKVKPPAKGLPVSTPTWSGSNSQLPT